MTAFKKQMAGSAGPHVFLTSVQFGLRNITIKLGLNKCSHCEACDRLDVVDHLG